MKEILDTNLCCPICLESNSEDLIQPCKICSNLHIHKKCYNSMINYNLRSCPTCRTPYGSNNTIIIDIETNFDFGIIEINLDNTFNIKLFLLLIIKSFFIMMFIIYLSGLIGGLFVLVSNVDSFTINPLDTFFLLQIIFGMFILLVLSVIFDCN